MLPIKMMGMMGPNADSYKNHLKHYSATVLKSFKGFLNCFGGMVKFKNLYKMFKYIFHNLLKIFSYSLHYSYNFYSKTS